MSGDGVTAWVEFLAADRGRIERVLAAHQQTRDGWCEACSVRPKRWPCPVAELALQARELRGGEN